MITSLSTISLALLLLFFGAEGLVRGSSSLALRAGLSRIVVGLTIVAFGTSSPELVVSVKAALTQQGDISAGNVVGSNVFNIGVILGITALLCLIPVHRQIIRIDAPIALGVACLMIVLFQDYRFDRIEGAILVMGSRLLVEHSIILARAFGVSEAVIGLTIIAAGTSMPELATSVVAALRKQPDIAIGNVVGSNVFNILAILGVSSVISPIHAPGISWVDASVMIGFTVLLIPLLYTGRLLHRLEGLLLLVLFGVYLYFLWPH